MFFLSVLELGPASYAQGLCQPKKSARKPILMRRK
jgi:hypothetical protein